MIDLTVFVPTEEQGREAMIAHFQGQAVTRLYDIGTFVSFETAEADAEDEVVAAHAVDCAQDLANNEDEYYQVTAEQGSVYPLERDGVLLGWEVEFMVW